MTDSIEPVILIFSKVEKGFGISVPATFPISHAELRMGPKGCTYSYTPVCTVQ